MFIYRQKLLSCKRCWNQCSLWKMRYRLFENRSPLSTRRWNTRQLPRGRILVVFGGGLVAEKNKRLPTILSRMMIWDSSLRTEEPQIFQSSRLFSFIAIFFNTIEIWGGVEIYLINFWLFQFWRAETFRSRWSYISSTCISLSVNMFTFISFFKTCVSIKFYRFYLSFVWSPFWSY